MIRYLLIFQKPHEVHSILAGFFQLSAGKNAALVSVCHYLEYHSRVGDRFSFSGRIRCVQFPVVQFLKLGAGHSDGCILRQFNFTVQYKNPLIISLNCGIRSMRSRVFHDSLILTQKPHQPSPFGMVDVVFSWAYFATGPIFSDGYFYMAHGSLGSQWENIACYGAAVCRHGRASRSAHVDVIIRAPEAAVDCHFRNGSRQTGLDA